MKDVIDSYDLFFSDEKERNNYINREMEILDYNSAMMKATEKGVKKDIKEGIAQEKENNFLAFVKKGLSVKMVADTIGLSKQELSTILKKHPELQGNFA
ncbi:MAG: hypothetical protein MR571_00585 [Succinatimonas sp.]|nr:hypothetical protein [Succinatimonas sp.]